MILPIYTYGNPVLRKVTQPIDASYPELKSLVSNMFETMYHADGVGLAAPQVGLPIRVLVIDLAPLKDEDAELGSFKIAMINPTILERSADLLAGEEGCLSIPGIHETVFRSKTIKVHFFDTDFNEYKEVFEDYKARVIQHEYDHLEGNLFTDRINPLRRQLLKSKLTNISKGKIQCNYKIITA